MNGLCLQVKGDMTVNGMLIMPMFWTLLFDPIKNDWTNPTCCLGFFSLLVVPDTKMEYVYFIELPFQLGGIFSGNLNEKCS